MPSLVDATSTAASKVGSYFNLVSALPSSLFVLFAYCLLSSGAPLSSPDWHRSLAAVRGLGLGDVALLTVAGLCLGLVLHPLQFSLVQVYEGYWGLSRIAVGLRTRRIVYYRRLRKSIMLQGEDAYEELQDCGDPAERRRTRLLTVRDEAARLSAGFPHDHEQLMPTRLGNVLRRYEASVGAPYGLDAPQIMPELCLVADPAHVTYLNDQRTLMDLSVRLSAMSFLASLCLMVCLWPYGAWLLLAAVAYGLGYLFYRGAVAHAHHYGSAMAAIVDLNRFTLYERLHLGRPDSTTAERDRNQSLTSLLMFDPQADVTYEHPAPPPSGSPGSP